MRLDLEDEADMCTDGPKTPEAKGEVRLTGHLRVNPNEVQTIRILPSPRLRDFRASMGRNSTLVVCPYKRTEIQSVEQGMGPKSGKGFHTSTRSNPRMWLAYVDSWPPHSFDDLLDEAELSRARLFSSVTEKERFKTTRGLVKMILGFCSRIDPIEISLSYDQNGKPFMQDEGSEKPIRFSVSHSDGLSLFGTSFNHEIGVDIERVRPISDIDQFAARFFSCRERHLLNAFHDCSKLRSFFEIWARKEAYWKACGAGLAGALRQTETPYATEDNMTHRNSSPQGEELLEWTSGKPRVPSNYAGAFVVGNACRRQGSAGTKPHA